MYKPKHCCNNMKRTVNFKCNTHDDFDCPDKLILYIPKFDEYGIIIHDGGKSLITIRFCPFCGSKLPNSKRNRWFRKMEKLGINIDNDEDIPKIYKSYGWWIRK